MKNKSYAPVLKMVAVIDGILWLLLLAAEATGALNMGWPAALLGAVWIPAVTFLFIACELLALLLAVNIKRAIREREVAKRIRAQAIKMGFWDKPELMRGKALDLWAREKYRIKRKRGETDQQLRERCMADGEATL